MVETFRKNQFWPAYCLWPPKSMKLSSCPLSRNWTSFSCASCAIVTCSCLTRVSSWCTWARSRSCSRRQCASSRACKAMCSSRVWERKVANNLDKSLIQCCLQLPYQNAISTRKSFYFSQNFEYASLWSFGTGKGDTCSLKSPSDNHDNIY